MRVLLLSLAGAAALVLPTSSAFAATPACPPTDDACSALAGRLDTLHDDLTTLDADLTASAGEPVSGTVALDPDTTDRLDLAWWGMWAVAGLLLLQIIAPAWRRVFTWGTAGDNH
jgi:hypothetical protein